MTSNAHRALRTLESSPGLPTGPVAAAGRSYVIGAPTISVAGAKSRQGAAVFLRDAFRPFYLGASLFGAIAIPLWIAVWFGWTAGPSLPPIYWHMHEMVHGFAVAVIIGFLFTAARNWTGLPLPSGVPLALLFGLWAVARIGMFAAYGPATALVDVLPLPIVAAELLRKFIRARNTCSLPLVGVLLVLAAANAVFHLGALGWISTPPISAAEAGLMLVVLVEMIVGSRVVPSFTASAVPGVRQYRPAWLQRAAIGLAALAFLADAVGVRPALAASLALAAGACVMWQSLAWNPLAARGRPMLWALHAAYAWIPTGLLLLGACHLGLAPRTAAIHALAVGSMGGLIIGMMTRTALGHSGRPVAAGRLESTAFLLVQVAAASRIAAAMNWAPRGGLSVAALAWSAAFLLYVVGYAPLLLGLRPRTNRATA